MAITSNVDIYIQVQIWRNLRGHVTIFKGNFFLDNTGM